MAKLVVKGREFDALVAHVKPYQDWFNAHLKGAKDPILCILKGHLLIEEQLFELIKLKSIKPDALKDSKLTFYQKLCIVEALYRTSKTKWYYNATKKLNKLRNDLSHALEPKGFDKRLRSFLDEVENNMNADLVPEEKRSILNRLGRSIFELYAYFTIQFDHEEFLICKSQKPTGQSVLSDE